VEVARLLLVGEGRSEMVRRTRRPLKHLAFIVGSVRHLHLRGDLLDLLRREFRAARLAEIAVGQEPHRVAVRADVPIDLEAALELRVVERAERRREAPALMRDLGRVIAVVLRRGRGGYEKRKEECEDAEPHHCTSSRARARAEGFGGTLPTGCSAASGPGTDSVMLPGKARGR